MPESDYVAIAPKPNSPTESIFKNMAPGGKAQSSKRRRRNTMASAPAETDEEYIPDAEEEEDEGDKDVSMGQQNSRKRSRAESTVVERPQKKRAPRGSRNPELYYREKEQKALNSTSNPYGCGSCRFFKQVCLKHPDGYPCVRCRDSGRLCSIIDPITCRQLNLPLEQARRAEYEQWRHEIPRLRKETARLQAEAANLRNQLATYEGMFPTKMMQQPAPMISQRPSIQGFPESSILGQGSDIATPSYMLPASQPDPYAPQYPQVNANIWETEVRPYTLYEFDQPEPSPSLPPQDPQTQNPPWEYDPLNVMDDRAGQQFLKWGGTSLPFKNVVSAERRATVFQPSHPSKLPTLIPEGAAATASSQFHHDQTQMGSFSNRSAKAYQPSPLSYSTPVSPRSAAPPQLQQEQGEAQENDGTQDNKNTIILE